jgi:ankyrin repeat protein
MPLVLATRTPELLKKLLERGVDIKKCPGILSNAVSRKSIESVKILLDAGVDPNEKPQGVHAPLMMAIINNNPEIVAYLLSRGADPNLKGINFPLVTAVSKPAILKQLIAAGADVNHCNGLLEQAVYHKNIESIDILLEAGVPIDGRPGDLHSPLTTAIRENNLDIISHLLSKGADPNAPGEGLPVTMAARFADTRRLKMILDAGADINWKYKGRTALMEASEWNMAGNVKFLLEKGADANTVDNTGKSAMDLAAKKGHNDIVTLLLDVMG